DVGLGDAAVRERLEVLLRGDRLRVLLAGRLDDAVDHDARLVPVYLAAVHRVGQRTGGLTVEVRAAEQVAAVADVERPREREPLVAERIHPTACPIGLNA